MIEIQKINEVPALTLPEVCEVLLDGKPVTVRVVNARRSGQIWLWTRVPRTVLVA